MANVLVTSNWYISSVSQANDKSRYYVTFQRLPESDHPSPSYWTIETTNEEFPADLAKSDFCANVVSHINAKCASIDSDVSNRTELYQD